MNNPLYIYIVYIIPLGSYDLDAGLRREYAESNSFADGAGNLASQAAPPDFLLQSHWGYEVGWHLGIAASLRMVQDPGPPISENPMPIGEPINLLFSLSH